jgi:hypothetical protein
MDVFDGIARRGPLRGDVATTHEIRRDLREFAADRGERPSRYVNV